MTVLSIENLVKIQSGQKRINDVSLSVGAGECVALLGHNGAGKTTLMRLVLGLSRITAGRIKVLDHAPGAPAARRDIGYLPENAVFHGALTGREQLHYFARLKSVAVSQADRLLDQVGLSDAADRKIRTYSKGMRQRVGLAQALLGNPRLVLLDEPTSGLDPISRHDFYDILGALSKAGTAVLLSSHALTELESCADRIAILSQGRLVADDTLSGLRRAAALPVQLRLATSPTATDAVARELGGQRVNGSGMTLTCRPDEKLDLLRRITELGDVVRDIEVSPASLEALFRHHSQTSEERA